MSTEKIHCYNKGCGQKFDPADNNSDSCLYHPGPEYFHDAYKIWQCCNKKSTDFSTWLSYKGCNRGPHNGVKPIIMESPPSSNIIITTSETPIADKSLTLPETIVWNGLNKPAERTDPEKRKDKLQNLKVEAAENVLKVIENYKAAKLRESDGTTQTDKFLGASCKNNACKAVYNGFDSEDCLHHPGTAVFHEGMKYWSCCCKKTSDFNNFMDQIGCTTGPHCWIRSQRVEQIREDWFSRCGYIHINIYCKGAVPDESNFVTDGLILRIALTHGFGEKTTQLDYELWGEIRPEESRVVIGERKVEIVLKQEGTDGWPRLRY